ncbi:hypothetical protein ACTWPT_08875 [Nonomuraea sp. 3N208]|uniref:hypothetical protein n=1 Tax=Nonomuraea sp. 3N208 TaxID=3457421 RepID=UPI003FCEB900
MYRQGLVLLGLVGGMVTFGGSALAATPSVTAESIQTDILPGLENGTGEGTTTTIGDRNNFGSDDDLVELDAVNDLLGVLSILSR